MSKKVVITIVAAVVVVGALVAAGMTVPVTLAEPPDEAVVYVDTEGRIVPPHAVPIEQSFLYEPMSYGEAIEQGHEPRDPEQMRVRANSAFEAIGRHFGYEPYLVWADGGDRLSYLE